MQAATARAAAKRLLALTAADLMTAPVMTLPQEMPLREAARRLHRSNVSGAPVVDSEGHCVGVLSSSDFVTGVEKGEVGGEEEKAATFLAPWGEWVSIDAAAEHEIRRYMTAQPVAVAPATPVGEVAQKMVDAHIHRVLVVVDEGRPCGIVTSTDILAAVAGAARGAAEKVKA